MQSEIVMRSLGLPGDDLIRAVMEYEVWLRDHVVAVPSGDKYWNYHFNRISQVEISMTNLQ